MSILASVTPLLITQDEACNLRRTLEHLSWARDIVIVDSGSTDATLQIAAEFPQVRIVRRDFDSFAKQCNFGLEQVATEWVLSLDADYVIPASLLDELRALVPTTDVAAYRCSFRYCVHGHPLRASLYPPRTVLFRRSLARYEDEGHGHRVRIDGVTETLRSTIDHDDRKPLSRWLSSQIRYAEQEAGHLLTTPVAALNRADRIRRWVFVAPVLVFFYTLICKGLILDGLPGWYYSMQRTLAELMLSLHLLHHKLEGKTTKA